MKPKKPGVIKYQSATHHPNFRVKHLYMCTQMQKILDLKGIQDHFASRQACYFLYIKGSLRGQRGHD